MMNVHDGWDWWHALLRVGAAAIAGVWAAVSPGVPYMLLCTGFVVLDCASAFALGRRVARRYGNKESGDAGKFKSWRLGRMIMSLVHIYSVVLLAHFAQVLITEGSPLDLRKLVAGAVCGWQFWSYLENCASCNGARWAKVARKILADKTARHLNIDMRNINGYEKD